MKKYSKGITLIALVITIIVLLILAGVTIVTLTGDNGLITKSDNAQKETLKAENEEKIRLEVLASYDNNGQIDANQLRINLQHIDGITTSDDEEITDSTTIELPMVVKIDGNEYLIKADGTTKAKYGIDEYDVAINPEKYYGSYVTNYNSPYDEGIVDEEGQPGKWQIFMADEDNIYLISSNYISRYYTKTKNGKGFNYDKSIENTKTAYKMWFTDILEQYNAGPTTTDIPQILSKLDKQSIYYKWMNNSDNQKRNYANEKAVSSMLDVEIWSGYNNTTYAKYAIGGPTIEMFCKSYNTTHTEKTIIPEEVNLGYKIEEKNLLNNAINDRINQLYFSKDYWLSSPAGYYSDCILFADDVGQINFNRYNISYSRLFSTSSLPKIKYSSCRKF